MVGPGERVRVMDFGLARVEAPGDDDPTIDDLRDAGRHAST